MVLSPGWYEQAWRIRQTSEDFRDLLIPFLFNTSSFNLTPNLYIQPRTRGKKERERVTTVTALTPYR
jgi:hypothetical protein